MVATPVLPLLHTPPGVASNNVVVPLEQIAVVPVIAFTAGEPFTTCVNGAEVLFEKFAGSPDV
jgi:hypothetical protein